MYRSRLKGKLDKDALKFLSSISDDLALLYYDIVGSEAHSLMLYENGLIDKQELKKIITALEGVKKQDLNKLASDEYEDIHEAVEAYVVEKAGIDAGGKMHTARSRNDQVALDIRMKVRDDINDICKELLALIDTLLKRADQNKDSAMIMYTHLQHAQIGTFSHYLLSYADALFRDLDRLYICYGRVNQSPLGASAIGGTSIKIDRRKTASLLGFDSLVENSIDATTARDFMTEFSFDLAMIMLDLSRIGEDFVLWSSSEFNYIELADEFTSSSSVMPQKKNPCPLELIRAKTSMSLGLLMSLMATVKSLPSGYSRDLQDTKHMLWQSISIVKDSLKIMSSIVESLKVNKKMMLESAKNSYAVSLDIAEELVRKGVAFRQAHKMVGSLVKIASDNKKSLAALSVQEIKSAIGKDFPADELSNIISKMDPKHSLESRISVGSPGPKEQERMTSDRKLKANGYRAGIEKRTKQVGDAFENLAKQVKSMLS
ncbi:MAG: argininosuccinate lyase [Nitrososphaerales archaeon]